MNYFLCLLLFFLVYSIYFALLVILFCMQLCIICSGLAHLWTIIKSETKNLWENSKAITNQWKPAFNYMPIERLFYTKHRIAEQPAGTPGVNANKRKPCLLPHPGEGPAPSLVPLPLTPANRSLWPNKGNIWEALSFYKPKAGDRGIG